MPSICTEDATWRSQQPQAAVKEPEPDSTPSLANMRRRPRLRQWNGLSAAMPIACHHKTTPRVGQPLSKNANDDRNSVAPHRRKALGLGGGAGGTSSGGPSLRLFACGWASAVFSPPSLASPSTGDTAGLPQTSLSDSLLLSARGRFCPAGTRSICTGSVAAPSGSIRGGG